MFQDSPVTYRARVEARKATVSPMSSGSCGWPSGIGATASAHGLLRREGRGRLVDDEHGRVADERLGDLDVLPGGDRQPLDELPDVELDAHAAQRLLRAPALSSGTDESR